MKHAAGQQYAESNAARNAGHPCIPPVPRSVQEKILQAQEFRGCAFSADPRLYSYKQKRHLEFAAMLLNPLNAPVLIIAGEAKPCRALFADYPSLQYIVTLDTAKPGDISLARAYLRKTAFPLDALLAGAPVKKKSAPKNAQSADLWMLFAALIGAAAIALLVLYLIS